MIFFSRNQSLPLLSNPTIFFNNQYIDLVFNDLESELYFFEEKIKKIKAKPLPSHIQFLKTHAFDIQSLNKKLLIHSIRGAMTALHICFI